MSPMMSPSTQSAPSMSTPASSSACFDPLDSLIDLSEYDSVAFHSPSSSPAMKNVQFSSKPVANTPATLPSTSQPTLSGPSHQYDLYRQQTGIPKGALANTLAINAKNTHINHLGFGDAYLAGVGSDDLVDFGTAPTPTFQDIEMEYDSPRDPAMFYPDQSTDYIDPAAVSSAVPIVASQTGHAGRLWPGMHQQQAAIAQAQAQQKQQQAIMQQQRQDPVPGGVHRSAKLKQSTMDPMVEEKISQLLRTMRQSSGSSEGGSSRMPSPHAMTPALKMRKDEEDMDEDERLLASEEGKKLSSKERRQLRNKVSARAFRSRRKEYIGQLEEEIAAKVNENHDLRLQNQALIEENTRLSDLTRMLLSSPAFSSFLDNLASNPTTMQQHHASPAPAPSQEQPHQQLTEPHQTAHKDVSSHAALQQQQQMQHVGMTMVPDQNVDFSMLGITINGAYNYQPQVYSVFSMPETVIDTELLSGKLPGTPAETFESEDEKVELPIVERAPIIQTHSIERPSSEYQQVVDEEFDTDPRFALFAASPPTHSTRAFPSTDLAFLSIKPQQYELVSQAPANPSSQDELSVRRMLKLCDNLEATVGRLENLILRL